MRNVLFLLVAFVCCFVVISAIHVAPFDEESDFKLFKKVTKAALKVGKHYASTQGIPLSDSTRRKKKARREEITREQLLENLLKKSVKTQSDATATGPITISQLWAIMPSMSLSAVKGYVGYVNEAMEFGSIDTCQRKAAFLAQVAYATSELKKLEDDHDGSAYEGVSSLGNTYPGDGRLFKSRGALRIIGRTQYLFAGEALKKHFLGINSYLAAKPEFAFKVGAWVWRHKSLNKLADQGTQEAFDEITKKINRSGTLSGKAERDAYWKQALHVLQC